MKVLPKYWLSLFVLAFAPLVAITPAFTQPATASKPATTLDSPLAQANIKQGTDPYYREVRTDMEGALGQLGQDYYVVYRIVERMARANALDEQPWRIRVSTTDILNASASNLNMLTFEGGLLEQLEGDTAALACIVGHEMAHHTEGHMPKRMEVAEQMSALQEEALEEARAEAESASQQRSIFGSVISVVTGVVVPRSRTGRIATGVTGQVLQGLNQEQTNQAIARAEEIYKARVEELGDDFSEVQREHESEADRVGYNYMVRAGFDPAGCTRGLGALTRTVHSRLSGGSHPKAENRVSAVSSLNTPANNQPLISQGEANLSRSPKPLEYGFGRDGGSIRVESRFGSQDIDDGFPQ